MEIDREHFSDNDDSPMVSNFVWRSCEYLQRKYVKKDNKIILILFEDRTFSREFQFLSSFSSAVISRYSFDNVLMPQKSR